MNYFIDTNLPVGYTIIHDKWHGISKSFINTHRHDSIFWSNLVKKEYDLKLNEIIDNVNIFLNYCKILLKRNNEDFLNYFDFENFLIIRTKTCLLDEVKKQKILEQFWSNNNFIDGISEVVYVKFIEFSHEFERQYLIRDDELKKILILHDCGPYNYLKYLDYLNKIKKWGIHSPDCEIIVDAHDCGIKNKNLIFVSRDNKMINIMFKHDTGFLSIAKFKSCN